MESRIHKFQVWDTVSNEMSFDMTIPFLSGYLRGLHSNGGDLSNLRYREFTGLTHEGDELYEGDIMRIKLTAEESVFYPIYFKDGCFMIGIKNPEPLHAELESWGSSITKVGNSLQNPQLLEHGK